MKTKTEKRKSRIGSKLKKAVKNLVVDVFGYETTVVDNIHAYYGQLSKETQIPKDEIVVRIFQDRENIRVTIYNRGQVAKEIPVRELVKLFTNIETDVFDIEAKTIAGIKAFLKSYSQSNKMDIGQLHICIMTSLDKVIVKGYDGTQAIQDIPLLVLIKYFTR